MNEREVKLISDLLTQGWTETDIQLKYGYSWNTIMKAKEEMARQANEFYSNNDLWREELSRYKQILNDVVASMNSMIENANTRPSAMRKAEKQRAECKENLQDLSLAENSPAQEQALRGAIQRITRRHIA